MSGISRWLWGGLVILTPLTLNPISYWHTEPDKAAVAIIAASLIIGRALFQGHLNKRPLVGAEYLALLLLSIYVAATANSIMPTWSFWGTPEWRNGCLMLAIGITLFFVARRQLYLLRHQLFVIQTILIGSGIVSALAILHYLVQYLRGGYAVRAEGTFGQPNLLAAYLAMLIPLSIAYLLAEAPSRRRYPLLLLALQCFCLLLTFSRGSWLAAMIGVVICVGLWLWTTGRTTQVRFLILALFAGLLTLVVLSLLSPLSPDSPQLFQAATSMFRWQGFTAQTRLLSWQSSIRAFSQKPLLGYGPATFRSVLDWYFPAELAPFGGRIGDQPHNIALEIGLDAGITGLIVYAGFFLVLFTTILSSFRHISPDKRLLRIGILGALNANLINGIFAHQNITIFILLWVLAGMAITPPELPPPATHSRRPALGILVVATCFGLTMWMASADLVAYIGKNLCGKSLSCDTISTLRLAGDLSPTPQPYRMLLAENLAIRARESGQEEDWEHGSEVYNNLVQSHPKITEFWYRQALYLHRWHNEYNRPDIAEASLNAYSTAIRLSSSNPDLWLSRALLHIHLKDFEVAYTDIQQAAALLDDYARYYGVMAIYELAQGNKDAAAIWSDRARQRQEEWDQWAWRRY